MMRRTLKTGIALAVAALFTAGVAFAGDQKREQKRDGSCEEYSIQTAPAFVIAGDQQQDRKKEQTKDCS